jgi:hypothetical protein
MRNRTIQTVFGYFNRIRNGRPAPLRADIDPVELKTVLPRIFILEMNRSGAIGFRLAGTRICSIMGRELRGEDFNMIWCKTDRHRMKLAAEAVLANQTPLLVELRAIAEDDAEARLEMLLLPLYSAPGVCDRLLGCLAEDMPHALDFEQNRQLKADRLRFPAGDELDEEPQAHSNAVLNVASSQVTALRNKVVQLRVYDGGRGR